MAIPSFQAITKSLGLQTSEMPKSGDVKMSTTLLRALLTAALADVEVDERKYCDQYPDVKEEIRKGNVPSAKYHYQHFGYFEGRRTFEEDFDEKYYTISNPDVSKSVADGNDLTASSHYFRYGQAELRPGNKQMEPFVKYWKFVLFEASR